jgi:hypothetical protein
MADAGYTGVTAGGAGFTGSAPVAGEKNAAAPYGAVIAYDTEIVFDDAEGETFVAGEADEVVATSQLSALLGDVRPRGSGAEIYADRRTHEESQAARRRFDILQQITTKYPWFDGSPTAWTLLEMTETGLTSDELSDVMDEVNNLLETRDRNMRSPYNQFLAPRQDYYQRPPRLPRR